MATYYCEHCPEKFRDEEDDVPDDAYVALIEHVQEAHPHSDQE
jgi:hypothetical protein